MATANSKQQNKSTKQAQRFPNGAPVDGFKKHFAHEFGDAYEIKPRRRHLGPPEGMEERRHIMYAGRTDHIRLAEKQAKQRADQERAQARTRTAPKAQAEPAPELADQDGATLARALIKALARMFGPALARALDDSPQARAELAHAFTQEPAQEPAPVPTTPAQARQNAEADRRLAAAMQADHEAEKAQAARRRPPTLRTRAQEPAPQAAPQVAPGRGLEARKGDRRRIQTKPVDPKLAKELRRYFAELDVVLNSEEFDELKPELFDFDSAQHSQKYRDVFLYMLHQDATARQAHNVASLEAYGEDAIIV